MFMIMVEKAPVAKLTAQPKASTNTWRRHRRVLKLNALAA